MTLGTEADFDTDFDTDFDFDEHGKDPHQATRAILKRLTVEVRPRNLLLVFETSSPRAQPYDRCLAHP
jgi:hypothetical protein